LFDFPDKKGRRRLSRGLSQVLIEFSLRKRISLPDEVFKMVLYTVELTIKTVLVNA
jgi:hypothetical protein